MFFVGFCGEVMQFPLKLQDVSFTFYPRILLQEATNTAYKY